MRYFLPIFLSVLLATVADATIWAFANRQRPNVKSFDHGCSVPCEEVLEQRRAVARFEHDAIRTSSLIVNVGAIACIFATLLRRVRERGFPEDRMTA